MSFKKIVGTLVEFALGAVVLVYLGLHTINFFMFTFPPDQQYLAWLGFGLTGGALIGYLVIFLWAADTKLKKTIAVLMMLVSGIGEILAAGFGMTIEAWSRMGWVMTQQDFDTMLLAIRALAFAHALALVVYIAGDKIGELVGDHDGDGTINAFDPDYKPAPAPAKQNGRWSLFGNRAQPPAPVQTNPLTRQYNLSEEQIGALLQLLNEQKVGQPANGNGATDPTKAAR
jgi:hypothetical protein